MASTSISANGPLRVGVILLTVGTALIHLYLGLQGFPLFVLNGFGYLGLLAALILPIPRISEYRNLVRWVLVGYTALTILFWILVGARNSIGYADKVMELVLVVLLVLDARGSRR
jgi:membrane-bound ClpP family serine protease